MRLIPVLDLQDGLAVHAIKGVRQNYQPVKSLLCDTADPVALARAFRDRLGLSELYVADLDAIQGSGDHRRIIARLAFQERMTVYLDNGTSDPAGASAALENGASKVIVGAETLKSWQALGAISHAIAGDRLIFSLDMVQGQVHSPDSELCSLTPIDVLARLSVEGWKQVILLDLARVGSESGVDRDLIAAIRQKFPGISLLVGGGVRDAGELEGLRALGVDGVLLATALHHGVIGRQHIPHSDFSSDSSRAK